MADACKSCNYEKDCMTEGEANGNGKEKENCLERSNERREQGLLLRRWLITQLFVVFFIGWQLHGMFCESEFESEVADAIFDIVGARTNDEKA